MHIENLNINGLDMVNIPCDEKILLDLGLDAVAAKKVVTETVTAHKWSSIRKLRDACMVSTDWTQMLDSPLNNKQKDEFAAYRKILRDIPQTFDNPDDVVWPAKPEL